MTTARATSSSTPAGTVGSTALRALRGATSPPAASGSATREATPLAHTLLTTWFASYFVSLLSLSCSC
jgi:hypothetical protein